MTRMLAELAKLRTVKKTRKKAVVFFILEMELVKAQKFIENKFYRRISHER